MVFQPEHRRWPELFLVSVLDISSSGPRRHHAAALDSGVVGAEQARSLPQTRRHGAAIFGPDDVVKY